MLLIKNAYLLSMEEVNYEVVDILVENGKISKVGKLSKKDYPEAKVIDAKKRYVTPGLVDPHCHVGMIESTIGWAGSDCNEMSNPITPELRAIDGIKPHDECFKEALDPAFKEYQQGVIDNAQALCKGLMDRGIKIVSGGTDNHLMLVDLTPFDLTGKAMEKLILRI